MEEDKLVEMLVQLEQVEMFRVWRDMIVAPYLTRLEQELQTTDEMSEPILRYKLKTYQTIKDLFINVFEQAKDQQKQEAYERREERRSADQSIK